jgi:WD40 repeat protein
LEIAAGMGRLRTLAYLPEGDKLASAGEGRMISIWSTTTGERLEELNCRTAKVLSMAVCGPNLIATGGSDNAVRIWNWQTRNEAEHFVGHTGSVATLAFDPASGVIVSGSYDTTVRVWRLAAGGGSPDTAGETLPGRRVR